MPTPAPAQTQGGDAFAVGSVWKGAKKGEGAINPNSWSLLVTSREGNTFQGSLRLPGQTKEVLTVGGTGTAPASGDGPVRFETDEKGDLKQHICGKVKGGAMTLDFEGTSRTGKRFSGTGWMERK